MISFKKLTDTDLEIASQGSSSSRIIFIRQEGKDTPLDVVEGARIILIGHPHHKLRYAMKSGAISRPKIGEIIEPISGNAYHQLRKHLDKIVPPF